MSSIEEENIWIEDGHLVVHSWGVEVVAHCDPATGETYTPSISWVEFKSVLNKAKELGYVKED